jgi:hypothetical protein
MESSLLFDQSEKVLQRTFVATTDDKEEIDSNDDTVLADIAKWRDTLRPI